IGVGVRGSWGALLRPPAGDVGSGRGENPRARGEGGIGLGRGLTYGRGWVPGLGGRPPLHGIGPGWGDTFRHDAHAVSAGAVVRRVRRRRGRAVSDEPRGAVVLVPGLARPTGRAGRRVKT